MARNPDGARWVWLVRSVGAVWLAAIAPPLVAQRWFAELGKTHLPLVREMLVSAAAADVDGDGDVDLVFAGGRNGFPGTSRLYRNEGQAIFTEVIGALPAQPATDAIEAIEPVDVDRDGDVDLVLANGSQFGLAQDRLWLNTGGGTFVDATSFQLPGDNEVTYAVVAGDVDGDGDADLLMGAAASQIRLYRNDGSGGFTDVTAAQLPVRTSTARGLVLTDVDGDRDLDLAIANGLNGSGAEQNWLWINGGNGVFTDQTATRLPLNVDRTTDVAAGDVDGDGDQDLLFTDERGAHLYLNNGAGVFSAAVVGLPGPTSHADRAVLVDLDGDADLDVLLAETTDRLFSNLGGGVFVEATVPNLPADLTDTVDLAIEDFDRDGDADVVLVDPWVGNRLLLNDGSATFHDAAAFGLPASGVGDAVVAGDIDADGDPDLVIGRPAFPQVLRNDRAAGFTDTTAAALPLLLGSSHGLALADLDGDQDLDLAIAAGFLTPGQNHVLRNAGNGTFVDATAAALPARQDESAAVAAGDVDGDGAVDLVFAFGAFSAARTGQTRLLRNAGNGTFADVTATNLPALAANTRDVALCDVDGDGDLDLVLANWRQQNRLWRNDGGGVFTDVTAAQMPIDTAESSAVGVGDVDGDGDPDLVFANGGTRVEQSRLYRNDGSGRFADVTASQLPPLSGYSSDVQVVDVDLDGDADLAFGNGYNVRVVQNELWLNDGSGTFTVATSRLPGQLDVTNGVAATDVDLDGDPDLVFANGGFAPSRNRLLFNLARQLDAPWLLRSGHDFRLDAWSTMGPVNQVDAALPFLSTAPAAIPFAPFGTIGIDPTWMAALPVIVIGPPERVGSLSFLVPSNPVLVGLTVHAQAVMLQAPWIRLSNVASDRLIR